MSEAEILAALLVANGARCKPRLPESDVRRIAASISRYPPTTHQSRSNPVNTAADNDQAPAEVEGGGLLADIRRFTTSYMVLPSEEDADLLALWILHTWTFEAAFATPYLRVASATADSGKTLLLEIRAALCRRGWHAVNPSTAVLYRKISKQQPTLLLDEMDNFPVDERRDALSVLNAGYKRGAKVDRCKENGDLEASTATARRRMPGSTPS